jgi:hypothetical protein
VTTSSERQHRDRPLSGAILRRHGLAVMKRAGTTENYRRLWDELVPVPTRLNSIRLLYIVAREQPLLCGYLMTTVGARSPDGHRVEIKLDERRGERRLQREARDPERRRGERRRQLNYASDLRARGYATVVQSEATPSPSDQPTREPVMAWQPRDRPGGLGRLERGGGAACGGRSGA